MFWGEKGSGSGLEVKDPLMLTGTVDLGTDGEGGLLVEVGLEGEALGVLATDGPLELLLDTF